MRTFYDILDVSDKATQEEILDAYRRKVIQNHPDKGGDSIEFMNIRKAYETLSNPFVREKYDLWLAQKLANENKQAWNGFMRQFTRKICKNNMIISLLDDILAGSSEIYKNLNDKPSYTEAAEIIKKCLNTIRIIHPELKTLCIELDSVCNDVILGKITLGQEHSRKKPDTGKDEGLTRNEQAIMSVGVIIIFVFLGFVIFSPKNSLNEHPVYTEATQDFVEDSFPSDSVAYEDAQYGYTDNESMNYSETSKDADEYSADSYSNKNPDSENYEVTHFNTGDIPYLQYWGKGTFDMNSLSELSIVNYSPTDAVVLLKTLDGKVIRNNFVNSKSSFTMKHIPAYDCIIKVMFGNQWNSSKSNGEGYPPGGFMEHPSYMQSSDIFDFNPIRLDNAIKYPTYSITLHKVENGNMQTEDIDKETFFN